jgi:hypothetical protein
MRTVTISRLRRAATVLAILAITLAADGQQGDSNRRPFVKLPPKEIKDLTLVTSPFLNLTMPAHAGHGQVIQAPVVSRAGLAVLPQASTAATVPSAPDYWGPSTTLRAADGWYSTPIHATVMPDGRVVMIGADKPTLGEMLGGQTRRSAFVLTPAPVGAPTPAELQVQPIAEPLDAQGWTSGKWYVDDDLVCAGQTLTSTGALFTAGGTRAIVDTSISRLYVQGLGYATVYDGQTWSRIPANMQALASLSEPARWYPTVTKLADGRLLVTSGFDMIAPTPAINASVEVFDPATGSWTVISPFRQTPFDIVNSDYTNQVVLPSPIGPFDILMFGEPALPVLFSSTSVPGAWNIRGTQPRPGSEAFQAQRQRNGGAWESTVAPNNGSSTALLPFRLQNGQWGYTNGSVIIAGGALGTPHAQAIDVYDPSTGAWRSTINTGIQRHDASAVLLPDGRTLIVTGHSSDPDVRRAAYVDPAAGFSYSLGSSDSGEVRGYHSVAVLLPDGRVLVGGGRDVVTPTSAEKPSFRYYYPYYLFVARPQIVSAPSQLSYRQAVTVTTSGAAPVEAVLMSLGSMTHEFDTSQRSIQLQLSAVSPGASGTYSMTITPPASAQIAPPGYYMLFVLDGNRVPSVAKIVQLR